MRIISVNCDYCGKEFERTSRRYNEAKKFNWKNYCSYKCHSLAKNKRLTIKCDNPLCQKKIIRSRHEYFSTKHHYCSHSCAAIVGNSKRPLKPPQYKKCPTCNTQFIGNRKYCSIKCIFHPSLNKQQILIALKKFYKINGRVPFKEEYAHYHAASAHFGSWNKSIKAAGLPTNPVKFAHKFIAKDGHKCDSLSEKIIDDWLFRRKIPHQRSVPYPKQKRLTADFLIANYWIEFFGLAGEHRRYDELRQEKQKLVKNLKLNFLEIYPKDLFPQNNLNQVLNSIILNKNTY